MKKNLLMTFAFMAVALFSCSKEEITPQGSPASLTIKVAGDPAAKSIGAPNTIDESKIASGVVLVFKGTGVDAVLDGKASFDFTTQNTPVTVSITAGIRHIYVIANVTPADFDGVTKVSDLNNLANKMTLDGMYTGTNLAMSGKLESFDASAATIAAPSQVTIPLSFVGSRVHIDWDLTGLPASMASFLVKDVYLLNVKSKSDYFALPLGDLTQNVTEYMQGWNNTGPFSGTYLPLTPMTNVYNLNLKLSDLTKKGFANNFFYVTENGTPNTPMIAVIEGEFNSIRYYYPIVINGTQNGSGAGGTTNPGDKTSTVVRGQIYNVKAIIKGLGNNNPYEPIIKGAIDVTITPAAWAVALQIDQEFN